MTPLQPQGAAVADGASRAADTDQSNSASSRAVRRTLLAPLLLFVLFGAFYTVPPQGADRLYHLSGIIEARNALREGQFPVRVAPTFSQGQRYPVFQFYGNFPFTLGGAVTFVPGLDAYGAWKVVVFLCVTAAGCYAYRCSLALTGKTWPSVIAGAVFVTAPYLATDFRARFAYTEAVSFCLLPVVFFYTLRAFTVPRWANVLAGGLAWALLALSHNITYLYGSLFFGLIFLSFASFNWRKMLPRMLRVGATYALGLALALWYVWAQLQVLPYISIATNNTNATPFGSRTWAPLWALLSPVFAISPTAKNTPYLSVQVGWPILAAVVVAAGMIAVRVVARATGNRRTHGLHKPGARMMARLVALFAAAFFIVWSPVDFWPHVPPIFWNLQITYRLLMFVVLAGSLLSGMVLAAAWRNAPGGMPAAAGWAGLLVLGVAAIPFQCWKLDKASGRTIRAIATAPDFGPGEKDYAPVVPRMGNYAVGIPPAVKFLSASDARAQVRPGRTTRAILSTPSETIAQLPVLYYPGLLEVRDGGRELDYSAFGHIDGLLAVPLVPGDHHLAIRFVGSRWANRASALAWLTLLVGAGVALKRRGRRAVRPKPVRAPATLPVGAAAIGAVLLITPLAVPGLYADWRREATLEAIGLILPSNEAFPGGKVLNAFDGDPDTEWVMMPGKPAWVVIMPPKPRTVASLRLEPRRTTVLAGWHKVGVLLYLGDKTVAEQTFHLPDAARQPVQDLTLDRPVLADGIELRFTEPVTVSPAGDVHVDPDYSYPGYREITIR